MERRTALKNMAVTVWGLVALPACDFGESQKFGPLSLTEKQLGTLTSTVDTLIPETDTPGAVELQVDKFLQEAIAHCYEKEVKDSFILGLDRLGELANEKHQNAFSNCSKEERISLLAGMGGSEDPVEQGFFALAKELAILGYTTSEYVVTHLTDYKMVPGHFHGCVSYEPKKQEEAPI